MQELNLSFWGVAAVVVLLICVVVLFYVIDRRMMVRFLRVLAYYNGSMAVVALYAWGVVRLNIWWGTLLFCVLMTLCVAGLSLRKIGLPANVFGLPLCLSTFVGMGCCLASVFLLIDTPHSFLLLSGVAIAAGQMLAAVPVALRTYVSSLRHTQDHCLYLLANGASHLEAVMPSVRRSVRAAMLPSMRSMTAAVVIAPSLFFCGMLLAGCAPLVAVVVSFLLSLAAQASCLLTVLLTLALADRRLFDRSGRFLL
jgi:putative ABC transport system permease protein